MANWLVSLHALAALAFAAFVALVVGANPLGSRAGLVSLGAAAFTIWSATLAQAALEWAAPSDYLWLEPLQMAGWLLMLPALAMAVVGNPRAVAIRSVFVGALAALGGALWLDELASGLVVRYTSIGTCVAALWMLAEVLRSANPSSRLPWVRFALGAAVVLLLTVVLAVVPDANSSATAALLLVRGLALATLAPLLMLLCVRTDAFKISVFVSRDALTAALIGSAGLVALLLPAILLYRLVDGRAGQFVPLVLSTTLAVVIGLALLIIFGREQVLWVRVQLSKHFYRFKYDYRNEWLRLTNTLASSSDDLPLPKRSIKALADIVSSKAGALFISGQGSETYVVAASWNTDLCAPLQEYRRDELLTFMEKASWIVDSVEYRSRAGSHSSSFLDDLLSRTTKDLLIVPLLVHDQLFGFVALERPADLRRLIYEDIDVLRTGGREVASHLAQYYLAQRLAEAKQFEDFGRMATFLVHDLSNISTQQNLILQNEERHRHNPEFIADAMRTIARSVDRINRLVALVRSGRGRSEPAVVDAASVVREAVRLCAGHSPPVTVTLPDASLPIMADADQLTHALAHLLRNAQQAVASAGSVAVSLGRDVDCALIKVSDDGAGMSPDFVQERLFRPFDSTKKGGGLGIGAFQIREAVSAARGTLRVQTVEGVGSVFSIRIPLHDTRSLSTSVAGG